jgi:hypothetical protein
MERSIVLIIKQSKGKAVIMHLIAAFQLLST